jgi:hypothetical protein
MRIFQNSVFLIILCAGMTMTRERGRSRMADDGQQESYGQGWRGDEEGMKKIVDGLGKEEMDGEELGMM